MKLGLHSITSCLLIVLCLSGCATLPPGNDETPIKTSGTPIIQVKIDPPKPGLPYTNSLGMNFVPIPGEEYAVQTTEVTIGQWSQIMGRPESKYFKPFKDDHPMVLIPYWEIKEFIARLNARELTSIYRLPDDLEWLGACQTEKHNYWRFNDNIEDLKNYAWVYENAKGEIQRVGNKKPNIWGLFDMYGNVWEYTATCARYLDRSVIVNTLTNPEHCATYILKGGSASSRASGVTEYTEFRSRVPGAFFGFRLLMEYP